MSEWLIVSVLLRLVNFYYLLVLFVSLFPWNELHISFMHFVLTLEEGARRRYVLNIFGDLLKI